MRSSFVFKQEFEHILAALTPQNRLAVEVSLLTGLRISDVLALKTSEIKERFSVQEMKTGKRKNIKLNKTILNRLRDVAGHRFVFPHRTDGNRHRTRQAVYTDIKRAARLFRCNLNVTPHSARKIYAVEKLKVFGSLKKVQFLLNHSDEAVTMLYALADKLEQRR